MLFRFYLNPLHIGLNQMQHNNYYVCYAFVLNYSYYITCLYYIFVFLFIASMCLFCLECACKCTLRCHLSYQKCPYQLFLSLKNIMEISFTLIITLYEYIKLSKHSMLSDCDPWKPISKPDLFWINGRI